MCNLSKYRSYSPTGYVRPFKKLSRFRPPREPSVERIQYAPTAGYMRSFEILMQCPNRVHAILRNTDAILQLGTCEGSKNGSVYATFGAVCGAYAIRPYDRVRVAFQKTVLFSSPSGPWSGRIRYAPTIGYVRPFKKLSRFRSLRGRLWSVCNTPLQLGTCDPMKY